MRSLNCFTLLVFITLFSCTSIRAEKSSEIPGDGPVITYKDGSIRGNTVEVTHGKSVHQFLGLPFAEPPTGKLRFAAPKPAKPWSGIRDATQYGPSCPQSVTDLIVENDTFTFETAGKGLLIF